jgi:hypothetical protein
LPSKRGFERKLTYIESSHGKDHIEQANRIKDIWYDFQADYLSLDIMSFGIDVFTDLTLPYFNEERGIQMPAFTVMNRPEISSAVIKELTEKTRGTNAIPNIFPISGTGELNSNINGAFRSSLQKKLWSFLVDEVDEEEFLIKNNKEFSATPDSTTHAFFLSPSIQTTLMINECLNLEMKMVNSNIQLDEGSGRKDRFSSISYGNWLAYILDQDLLKENNTEDDFSFISSLVQSV